MDFFNYSVVELAAMVREGDISASELTEFALKQINKLNPLLNCFVEINEELAVAQAKQLDLLRSKGLQLGKLAGIPIGVKDLEDAKGFHTTKGSFLHANDGVKTTDSDLVKRLKAAGCVVIGKTNTPEFGYMPDTVNPLFGATHNPWNLKKSPGGSSGGSGAAVASGMVPLATGSDGGGSIRIPSALCGIPGVKPSLGRIPSGPAMPEWFDLSTKGVMARRLSDIAAVLDVVIGPEQSDLYSLPMPEPSWFAAVDMPSLPKVVAFSIDLGYGNLDDEIKEITLKAVEKIAQAGCEVIEVKLIDSDPVNYWLNLANSYNWRSIKPFYNSPLWEKVDPLLKALLEQASRLSAQDLLDAQAIGFTINQKLVEIFQKARVLLCPTIAGKWPDSGQAGTINSVPDLNWVKFTYPFNMTRSPCAVVPIGFCKDKMPVSLQIVGPQHADAAVIRAACAIEAVLNLQMEKEIPSALTKEINFNQ
jgi:aspartyl-tRNA(Asn)/glutamyl-tRNA(Gln) amidotransferase subunit A